MRYTAALDLLQKSSPVLESENGKPGSGESGNAKPATLPSECSALLGLLQDLAILRVSCGEWNEAYRHYKRMLDVCSHYPSLKSDEAAVCMRLGWVRMATHDLPATLGFFKRALDLYERLGEHPGRALALRHIGHTYSELNDFHKAAISHEQSYHVYRDMLQDREGQARCYADLGQVSVREWLPSSCFVGGALAWRVCMRVVGHTLWVRTGPARVRRHFTGQGFGKRRCRPIANTWTSARPSSRTTLALPRPTTTLAWCDTPCSSKKISPTLAPARA